MLLASIHSHLEVERIGIIWTASVDDLKGWFLAIRQARILMDTENLSKDSFSTSRALQHWIGIDYEVTDEEVRPILENAVETEIRIGLDGLDTRTYATYFEQPLHDLLSLNTTQLKTWFVAVRSAQIQQESSNIVLDEFMVPGAINSWANIEI